MEQSGYNAIEEEQDVLHDEALRSSTPVPQQLQA
jgi:hypothetical protein